MFGRETRLLVLAPHVDDELNCGGLIARVTSAGGTALVVAGCACYAAVRAEDRDKNIAEEFRQSCGILRAESVLLDWRLRQLYESRQEILDRFVSVGRSFGPTVVVCPSSTDMHQDHQVFHAEALRAFRNVPLLLGWESPNNQRRAVTNCFVSLGCGELGDKLAAYECYETQHHRDYFDAAFIRDLAEVRGRQCRCESRLAEAYELMNLRA